MLTVSIVTYKTPIPELKKCFDSLQSEVVDRIFVIDNSSKDYLANFCRIKKRVEYIASKNIGYGAAHNIAIRKAIEFGSKYHLVLNSDVYFEPNVLNHLIAYMEERNGVAMVQPNIIYPDGSLQYTCRLLPTPANLIFRRFLPKKMVESMNYKYLLKMFDHKSELNVPYH